MDAIVLKGLIIGFSIAAPVGPIGVLCIRRTLAFGRGAGLVSGLGAATADAFYGSVAGFGLTVISSLLIRQGDWLRLVGGLFLIYLGIRTFLAAPQRLDEQGDGAAARLNLFSAYTSTLFLTLTNPLTILSFSAIFAGLGLGSQATDVGARPADSLSIGTFTFASPLLQAGLLVLGVFLGSAAWWFILSSIASLLRGRFGVRGMRWVNRLSGTIIVIFGLVALFSLLNPDGPIQAQLAPEQAGALLADTGGYARATAPRDFTFPQDHGAHPDYQTEWWYYTGNLESQDGRRFGYQLTFFRRALTPPAQSIERPSAWSTNQVYLAHFAISDVSGGRYQAFERMARGAAGLAGALPVVTETPSEAPTSQAPTSKGEPPEPPAFQVWLYAWRVEQVKPGVYRLLAEQDGFSLDLKLVDSKGPILQGDSGYSQKGPEPGNASYYVSLTRLDTSGYLQIDQATFEVAGLSWMDHEYSTSALSKDQVGWDWFALQLDNGSELMVFTLRREDGIIDPFSSGTLIRADGSQLALKREDFKITVSSSWRSPHSQAEYPASWTVEVPAAGIRLQVEPLLADQELNLTYAYWEGAVQVSGEHAGQQVKGYGYVELTGYAGTIAGEF